MYAAEMQNSQVNQITIVEAVYMLPNLTKLLLTLAHTLVVKYQDSSQEISAKKEEDKINWCSITEKNHNWRGRVLNGDDYLNTTPYWTTQQYVLLLFFIFFADYILHMWTQINEPDELQW